MKASQPLLKYPVFGEQLGITGGTAETYAKGQSPPFMRIWTTSADTYLSELDVPLLAIFGDRDDKIHWRESVRAYREAYARAGHCDLTIKVFKNRATICLPCARRKPRRVHPSRGWFRAIWRR